MTDPASLFAQAERAFQAGQLDVARGAIGRVQQVAGDHPAVLHLLALVEKKSGARDAARAAFERAVRLAPNDPQLLVNYANLLAEGDAGEDALVVYGQALRADSRFVEARFNRALLLQKLGRNEEALADLDQVMAQRPADARTLSARGSVLRDLERLAEAASSYDAALRIDPARPLALHGRARVAMERGEEDASLFYRRALSAVPNAPELQLGLAEALEAEGKPGGVEALAAAVARQPDWIEGQAALARMRWEAGEGEAFTRAMEQRLAEAPGHRALWTAYATALGAADLHARAADAAAAGRKAAGDDGALMLAEAHHASEAGDIDRAGGLFARLPNNLPNRLTLAARHWLRHGDYAQASRLVDLARDEAPHDVAAWALTSILWRIAADPRSVWLSEQPGLICSTSLGLDPGQIETVAALLRGLHRTRAHPIGQSLRGGTQTRGALFAREEPEIRLLRSFVARAVTAYWGGLPREDPAHPLLRHRSQRPRIVGSWSVRLTGGGFHIAHFHSRGLVSSACYFVVPQPSAPLEGWLEVGGPPHGVDLPLAPLARIEPAPGRLALFPSYLYHGTRPFAAGERLTAAFDVSAR
ncbi:MAG TPA: putative 2OG-Fe(II) oxygenase [Allosphingosinicella sp.]|jgi:Flp pilus assembly protein TadD